MKKLLIQNGLVVSADGEAVRDILCEGETITRLGSGLRDTVPDVSEVIDAAGMVVIPGGVDAHTHLNLDMGSAVASDDFYTGTVAAACGGTTTIVDHPGFGPAGCGLDYQIRRYHGYAENMAVIDYGFHGVIQHVDDAVLAMMETLAGQGITSYKVYLTYAFKLDDADVLRVLRRARELGVLITVHAENDGVIRLLREEAVAAGNTMPRFHPRTRPAECEAEAVGRMILLARLAGNAPLYIVHVSSALALADIARARRGGSRLWAETCPQYLLLDESRYELPATEGLKYLMCPPLRTGSDNAALWQAVGLAPGPGPDIDTVATDHCPFMYHSQKMAGKDDFTRCPSGAPGIEERIALMYSEGVVKKRITLRRMVELCCANPAKLLGLYPRKGVIAPGSDADLVIIDPRQRRVIRAEDMHARVDYSAYEGFEVHGWPVCTVSRGEVIVRDGVFTGEKGRGKFLTRDLMDMV